MLPFDATVVVSRNDPYCSFMRACTLARAWGAQVVDIGHCGHVNDSVLGEWSQGHDLLNNFLMMVE
jgi:predicted alpha/beta hydrolase family esterase